jgi:hypothetical protein
MNFRDYLKEDKDELNEGLSPTAKAFMKEFNNRVKLLKDDVKKSDSYGDWHGRLESIKSLITKELDKRYD